MIRFLLACALCIFPFAPRAQPVTVISGEHADFSRLVVLFDTAVDWDFGRVPGGYELRTDARTARLEGPQIFDFIPKSRISAVSFPGPGRMFLAVTCPCSGDVFELRQGRLAIDIKDGSPEENSRFEGRLAPLAEGNSWQRVHNRTDSSAGLILNTVDNADRFNDLIVLLQKNLAAALSAPIVPQVATPNSVDAMQSPSQETTDPIAQMSELTTEPPVQAASKLSGTAQIARQQGMAASGHVALTGGTFAAEPRIEQMAAMPILTPDIAGPILSAWPRDWEQGLAAFDQPASVRVAIAKNALLQQLSRAAAQGVVQIDLPTIAAAMPDNAAMADENEELPMPAPAVETVEPRISAPVDHLRVQTVVDRDAKTETSDAAYTDLGYPCLVDDLMQVADWGPVDVDVAPLSDLRAKMLQEFDNPDSGKIEELARRYIYLGFGAEAINLIDIFAGQIEGADILLQIADIIDDGSTSRPGRLVSQLTCATSAAMWAILAQTRIPGGVDVQTNNVLRTFAGLPVHLRRQLGPGLADRFLKAEDAEIASTIRDITERASVGRDAGFEMMQANIASYDGDTGSALRALKAVAASGSPAAPVALAELLETKLAIGDSISQNTAVLADAMAMENRGTEIGGRLTLAAIRGYAASGQIDVTFDRIASSLQSGLITGPQADILANEAHMRSAEISQDVDFLRVLYLNPLVTDVDSEQQRDVRRAVATRLIDLGLAEKAKQHYGRDPIGLGLPDQQILARAELELGNFDRAGQILQGAQDQVSARILARSSEMRGDYTTAGALFETLDMTESRQSAAWRAGDWPLVAKVGTDPRSLFAELLLSGERTTQGNPGTGSDIVDKSQTIAAGKSMLDQSQLMRELVDNLLIPAQP